jgi:hypothetical protein
MPQATEKPLTERRRRYRFRGYKVALIGVELSDGKLKARIVAQHPYKHPVAATRVFDMSDTDGLREWLLATIPKSSRSERRARR